MVIIATLLIYHYAFSLFSDFMFSAMLYFQFGIILALEMLRNLFYCSSVVQFYLCTSHHLVAQLFATIYHGVDLCALTTSTFDRLNH